MARLALTCRTPLLQRLLVCVSMWASTAAALRPTEEASFATFAARGGGGRKYEVYDRHPEHHHHHNKEPPSKEAEAHAQAKVAEAKEEAPKNSLENEVEQARLDEAKQEKELGEHVGNIANHTVGAADAAGSIASDAATVIVTDSEIAAEKLEGDPEEVTLATDIYVLQAAEKTMQFIRPGWLQFLIGLTCWGGVLMGIYTVHSAKQCPEHGLATLLVALLCCPCGCVALCCPLDEGSLPPQGPWKARKPVEDPAAAAAGAGLPPEEPPQTSKDRDAYSDDPDTAAVPVVASAVEPSPDAPSRGSAESSRPSD